MTADCVAAGRRGAARAVGGPARPVRQPPTAAAPTAARCSGVDPPPGGPGRGAGAGRIVIARHLTGRCGRARTLVAAGRDGRDQTEPGRGGRRMLRVWAGHPLPLWSRERVSTARCRLRDGLCSYVCPPGAPAAQARRGPPARTARHLAGRGGRAACARDSERQEEFTCDNLIIRNQLALGWVSGGVAPPLTP